MEEYCVIFTYIMENDIERAASTEVQNCWILIKIWCLVF